MTIAIADTRRARLKSLGLAPATLAQCAGRTVSYWHDLMAAPKKSFGERAARSIELDLGLPDGWLDQETDAAATISPLSPSTPLGPIKLLAPLPRALEALADALANLPPARWASVRAQFDQLASHPEMRDDVLAELTALLTAPAAKD